MLTLCVMLVKLKNGTLRGKILSILLIIHQPLPVNFKIMESTKKIQYLQFTPL